MYPATPQKIRTQIVDSTKIFQRWILQKQSEIVNKNTKSWYKNTIKDLEHLSPKQIHDSWFSFLNVLVKDRFT